MKKWPIVLLIIIFLAAFIITYPSFTGNTIQSPYVRNEAAGIAVVSSLIVIGIIGWLSSRPK